MTSPEPSLAVRVLSWLADAVYHHRRWFLYPQVVLAAVCAIYAARCLKPNMDRNALIGGEKESHKIYLEFLKEFPAEADLVVVVESENMERNRQFVERLGAKLDAETNLFTGVFYKGDLKVMGPKALLFLPEKDLKDLGQTFRDYRPVLQQFTKATNLVSLVNLVNRQFGTAKREANEANDALVKALPALIRVISQANDALKRSGTPPSPGVSSLFENAREAEEQMYITFNQGRIYLVTAQAKQPAVSERAVERMRELIAETQIEVPGLNVGFTGEPVLEVDEMLQSEKDTITASIVSLVLCSLIFIYGYNETGRPLKAVACLLVGISYTMGYTTLVVGHLNILTITFVPILIGLAIDFGVHLITRYEEELRRGRTERQALDKAMIYTGMGIFSGAFTTAGAFFAMGLTDFKGIQEMGIICGGGLLVCLVPMMTLLPVLLLHGQQNVLDHELGPGLYRKATTEDERRARIESFWLNRPVATIAVIVVASLLCLRPAQRVAFDYNLLHMQSAGLPAVIFQDKLIQSANRPLLFGAVVAGNLTEAVRLTSRLTNLPTVGSLESMVPYLAEDQTKKLALLAEVKRVASSIQFLPLDKQPADLSALRQALFSLHGYAALATQEVEKEEPDAFLVSTNDFKDLRSLTNKLASRADPVSEFLWRQFSADTRRRLTNSDGSPASSEALPLALIGEFNRVLQSDSFYEARRFTNVNLSLCTRVLLQNRAQATEQVGLNRRLLEEAYPAELAPSLPTQLRALREAVGVLDESLLKGDAAATAQKLAQFQTALFSDVQQTFEAIQHQDDRGRMQVEDLPVALRNRFIGVSGKLLLQVYPKENVWERQPQEAFVRDLRSLDPRVTGTPVQLLEYETLLKTSFEKAAVYSLIAIAILVFLHFRRVFCVVLSLIPVGVGSLWMVGLMGVYGVPFNPANIMTLPLVIGVGVTNGIHILNRFAEEQHPSILARSTGKAVLVSGLNTIAGFGSLILAQHQGIRSLGYVMSTGTATCMFVGLTFLPAILNLLMRVGWTMKKPSATCTVDTGSGGTEVKTSSLTKP